MSGFAIKKVTVENKELINHVVDIHLATFKGFFLTFMGKGFLKQMYKSYVEHPESGIYVASEGDKVVGFLAYSENMSGLYKHMIKHRLIQLAWYSMGAFIRKPKVFMRLVRAFLKPKESERDENYVELASIGVRPDAKSNGIGSKLIDTLKNDVDFKKYKYITLETDAVGNEVANHFYKKNGFYAIREFVTHEGRRMYEYRYEGGAADEEKTPLHIEYSKEGK